MAFIRLPRRFGGRHVGVATIEVLAALAVMVVVIAFVAQWSTVMMQHRRAVERRRVAMQAIDNLLAWTMAVDYEQVTAEQLLSRAQATTPRLATWRIEVADAPGAEPSTSVAGKRVLVGLSFDNSSHYDVRPIVAFRYPMSRGVGGAGDE